MTYKRAIPAGAIVSYVMAYTVCALILFSAFHRIDWWRGVAIGVGGLLITTVALIPLRGAARYTLDSQHLYIKGKINKQIVDKKIPYRNIVSAISTGYYNSAVQQIRLSCWDNGKMEYVTIPAPGLGKKKAFLRHINAEIDKQDFSHIINPQFIDTGRNTVSLKVEDCSFLDYSQLDNDLMIALVKHNDCIILLGHCVLFTKTKFIHTTPPMTMQEDYIYCDFINVLHLKYKSVHEAINDVKWISSMKNVARKEVRVIDEIAYNRLYGNLQDEE